MPKKNLRETKPGKYYGHLHDYKTGEIGRLATAAEERMSKKAAAQAPHTGAITIGSKTYYVERLPGAVQSAEYPATIPSDGDLATLAHFDDLDGIDVLSPAATPGKRGKKAGKKTAKKVAKKARKKAAKRAAKRTTPAKPKKTAKKAAKRTGKKTAKRKAAKKAAKRRG